MDPFARKMWRAGFGFAGLMLALFASLTIVYMHEQPSCPDRVVMESDSPDKKWTAAILERRCGAEAPFVTQVNLRPAGPLLRGFFSGQARQGSVFVVEQDAAGAGITTAWSRENALLVRCTACNAAFVRQRDPQWDGIQIQYQQR
jgi:hypothetical protein